MSALSVATGQDRICVERVPPPRWNEYLQKWGYDGFHLRSEWARVFTQALGHDPWFIWVERAGAIVGVMPLMHVKGPLFGSFLVSQPYINSGGLLADDSDVETLLVDRAVALADTLDVKHLELRHERVSEHPRLNAASGEKVHMRLQLPHNADAMWNGLKSKLRSQIRKPLNDPGLGVAFGRHDQLGAFYKVFCTNMRDLGTPPFPRSLFGQMLDQFPDEAEICTVTLEGRPVAAGFLLHAPGVTLIPSASSLRKYNPSGSNMLLYWRCLERSLARGQATFDFGRSTRDSGTYRFKQQWGAVESPATWQYCVRRGAASDMRPAGGKFDMAIAVWQRLPVWLTRVVGPAIVRGIP